MQPVVPELILLAMAVGAVAVAVAYLRPRRTECVTIRPASPVSPDRFSLVVRRGTEVLVLNNDLVAHRLVQVDGPPLELGSDASLDGMGSGCIIRFAQAGTYELRTTTGRGYVPWLDPETRRITLQVTVSA
jgi:hypothetical protein